MKICVSSLVDVCYVIIYTKKSRVNQNIEMVLMPRSSASYYAYFFHPPRIWIRTPLIVTILPQIHPSTIILTYGAGTDEHR